MAPLPVLLSRGILGLSICGVRFSRSPLGGGPSGLRLSFAGVSKKVPAQALQEFLVLPHSCSHDSYPATITIEMPTICFFSCNYVVFSQNPSKTSIFRWGSERLLVWRNSRLSTVLRHGPSHWSGKASTCTRSFCWALSPPRARGLLNC